MGKNVETIPKRDQTENELRIPHRDIWMCCCRNRPICVYVHESNSDRKQEKLSIIRYVSFGADIRCPIEFAQWLINFTTFQFVLIWKNQKTINFENVWTLCVINGFRFRNWSWYYPTHVWKCTHSTTVSCVCINMHGIDMSCRVVSCLFLVPRIWSHSVSEFRCYHFVAVHSFLIVFIRSTSRRCIFTWKFYADVMMHLDNDNYPLMQLKFDTFHFVSIYKLFAHICLSQR